MPGYFVLDEAWKPDDALVDFLQAGAPPIVFTFGSMTHEDPAKLTRLILESIERVGCRAVIQQGWTGLGKGKLPPHIHPTGLVSHEWLFPRAACIIHHGGAGTAGTVFRSGKPSVFVPHTFDHPLWAELAHDIGCAGPPLPYAELSADRLTEAIKTTLSDPAYSRTAADLGDRVRAEQGVIKARRLVEQLVHRVGWSGREANPAFQEAAQARAAEDKLSRRRQYLQQQRNRKREKIAFDED
jgi:UDP:flavonoid glycosyltransferase YjiC (YdhE family)